MKKLFTIIALLFISIQVWCYSYPYGFFKLLYQFMNENRSVSITTDDKDSVHEGTIVLIMDDYIVLNENDGNTIIVIDHISTISTL